MAENDFRVTSIFKIIIRICMKNVEFCRKTTTALRGHVTQLIFFATLIKFLLRKIFFATLIKVLLRKKVFAASCFFSTPISKFFVSFIILICKPVFFATQVILLQFFFFSFHLIYLCYSIFLFQMLFFVFV